MSPVTIMLRFATYRFSQRPIHWKISFPHILQDLTRLYGLFRVNYLLGENESVLVQILSVADCTQASSTVFAPSSRKATARSIKTRTARLFSKATISHAVTSIDQFKYMYVVSKLRVLERLI